MTYERDSIRGTLVVIDLFTPESSEWAELWPNAVERRSLQRAIEDGKTMLVSFQLWVEFTQDGLLSRLGGTRWGPGVVRVGNDPTVELATPAYDGRSHMGDLYGDLVGILEIGKWDLYAAPFRLELTSAVSARLG